MGPRELEQHLPKLRRSGQKMAVLTRQAKQSPNASLDACSRWEQAMLLILSLAALKAVHLS